MPTVPARGANAAKDLTLVFLLVATSVMSVFAWRDHKALIAIQTEGLPAQRTVLEKRLEMAVKREEGLTARLEGRMPEPGAAQSVAGTLSRTPRARLSPEEQKARSSAMQKASDALRNSPEYQALDAKVQRAKLDAQYGNLFRSLNLDSAQADKLETLLIDKTNAYQDTRNAAIDQGLSPEADRDSLMKAYSTALSGINADIKGILGDAGYQQLTQYNATSLQRNTVDEIQQSLSYSGTPLTDQQSAQLAQVLKENPPAGGGEFSLSGSFPGTGSIRITAGPVSVMVDNGEIGVSSPNVAMATKSDGSVATAAVITSQAVTVASSFLSAQQLQALRQIQAFQQSQQQVGALLQQGQTPSGGQPPPN